MTKSPSDLTFIRFLLGSLLTLIWAGSEHPLSATLFLFPSSRKALERVGLSNKNPLFIFQKGREKPPHIDIYNLKAWNYLPIVLFITPEKLSALEKY